MDENVEGVIIVANHRPRRSQVNPLLRKKNEKMLDRERLSSAMEFDMPSKAARKDFISSFCVSPCDWPESVEGLGIYESKK